MVPEKYVQQAERAAIGRQFTAGRPKEAWVADYADQLAREDGWRPTRVTSSSSSSSSSSAIPAANIAPPPVRREIPQTLPSAEELALARAPSHYTGNNIKDFLNGERMMHETMRAHNPAGWVPFDVRPPNPAYKPPVSSAAASAAVSEPPPPTPPPTYHGRAHRHQAHPPAAQPSPEVPTMPAINPALARSLTIQMPSEQAFGGNQILQMLLGNAGGGGGFSGGDWGIPQHVPVKPRMSISDKILRHFEQKMYHPEEYPEGDA